MSNKSPNWIRHSVIPYLHSLLTELLTDEGVIQKDEAILTSEVHPDEGVIQKDEAILTSEVHPETDIIDLSIDVPSWARIRFKTTTADLPEPLVADTVYYAIRTSENHIQVAVSKANAKSGIHLDITDIGSGTHTLEQIETDIIDLSIDVHSWARIRFKTTAADLPEPLVADTVYYAIRVAENQIQVAVSKANAKAGTHLDITSTGSGTHTLEQIEKKADKVETTPTNTEWKDSDKVVFIYPGADEHIFSGVPGSDVELSVPIFIKCWGSPTAAEGIILSLERLLAEVRDKIGEGIVAADGFKSLDPPAQVEGCSISDDPGYSMERDLSTATLELRITNHGS